jgi:tetratricopeptide (TPR) repeat protein
MDASRDPQREWRSDDSGSSAAHQVDATCRQCGTRQAVPAELTVSALDVAAVRSVLMGRPRPLLCKACGDVLPIVVSFEIRGEQWTARVSVDGSNVQSQTSAELMRPLSTHLDGLIGALWRAPDREAQLELASKRHRELSAEAIAAAVLAAEGLVGDWVVGDGGDPAATVDDMLGLAQARALILEALSVVPDDGPELASVIRRHVASGLVLPRALDAMTSAVSRMLDTDRMEPRARFAVLSVHAAAHLAADRPDPLASRFTRDWIAVAWAADERPADEQLRRLQLSPELLARAIDPAELAAAVLETTDAPAGWIERMQRIAEQAGLPQLIRQVAPGLPVLAEAPAEVFREALTELASSSDDPRALVEGLRFVLGALLAAGRTDQLEEMTDHALSLCDRTDTVRALLLAQFGAAAKDARMPDAFLAKVGDRAQPWEEKLPDGVRLALHTERASALRIAGRAQEAQAILEPFLQVSLDPANRWLTELNLAMVIRDGGAADAGLRATEDLLARADDDEQRFLATQSLARTTTALGRHDHAVAHLRSATALAYGRYSEQAPVLRASLAALLAAAGDTAGAIAELELLGPGPLAAQAALGAADAVTVLIERGEELGDERVAHTAAQLQSVLERAQAAGDRTVAASALRVRARLRELLGDTEEAAQDWQDLLNIFRDPFALVSLAKLRLMAGQPDAARALLTEAPEALLEEHGGATDIGAILDVTGRLRAGMRQLSTVMMAGRPLPGDVRLAAELSRDAIGRTRSWASARGPTPSRKAIAEALPDRALSTLAPAKGALRVLEWWEGEQGVVSLMTRITADGRVAMRALPAMPALAPEVAEEILARLQGWWPGRPGDPLAHAGWHQLADWLRDAMSDASTGDHLVVIEHQGLVGLPWHSIDDVTWTTSYSPGWSALLDMPSPRIEATALGIVSVPARGEAELTLRAFAEEIDRARRDAELRGLRLETLEGAAADEKAVRDLLCRSDLAVLHCHGLIDPDQLDLALLVAHAGQLPSQHPIAAASPHGRANRLTWRALQELPAAPALVLSAACSSGQGLIGGLGERLGLFAALRSRGNHTVVAPAWDAVAGDVVAQLSDVRELVLDGVPLGQAVKSVSDRSAERLPSWRARVLSVEGDWR